MPGTSTLPGNITSRYAFHCEVGGAPERTRECVELFEMNLDDCTQAWHMHRQLTGAEDQGNGSSCLVAIILCSVLGVILVGVMIFFLMSSSGEGGDDAAPAEEDDA